MEGMTFEKIVDVYMFDKELVSLSNWSSLASQ
ncbi:Abi family protein [Listeria booriae]|uniref:Abi family protein n=1 Tax=Listeria booriae TaxID=1552123 RepID=A0A7X0XG50_9LIST|nr:Abi family protein [Listeria booriae]MBC1503353.1 Abi family protein [Listeria booriae]MBC1524998.1 Abi family protein [Listeria booriae]MBC1530175.1 Abi family protein [Listeria booriae]